MACTLDEIDDVLYPDSESVSEISDLNRAIALDAITPGMPP